MAHDDQYQFIFRSQRMNDIVLDIKKIAQYEHNVLVTGNTGSGKELVAKMIHDQSPRSGSPFVAVNCAALPDSLIESELFGHEKGAFTGASITRKGKFELADGGTLFLDEIGDLSLVAQAKMLRVLQDGTFYKVGGEKVYRSRVRIVAATNKDLALAVKEGSFRADLYYRLLEDHISLPDLHDRSEDIVPLIEHFLELFSDDGAGRGMFISSEAESILRSYQWPGNVRELKSFVKKHICHFPGEEIDVHHLPKAFLYGQPSASSLVTDFEMLLQSAPLHELQMELVNCVEKSIIKIVLEKNEGRKKTTARMLGMALNTLKSKIKKYEISDIDVESLVEASHSANAVNIGISEPWARALGS